MARRSRYYMLMASLPHLPPLFAGHQIPISRRRLDKRLDMLDSDDRAELADVEVLMRWDLLPLTETDRAIVERANEVIPLIRRDTLRHVASWRLELRTVVAALRRRAAGQSAPPSGERWGYGRWVRHLERNWSNADFGLGEVLPWISEFNRLMVEGDALGFERELLGLSYSYMSRAAQGHYFTFEAVALYVLRWDVFARWTACDGARARERFEQLTHDGLGANADLFAGLESR